jgi:dihydropteroate synthase
MKPSSSPLIKPFLFGKTRWLLGGSPRVMGILNITPDSFSDGGRFADVEPALDQALRLEREGADMLDIGGESTRPGAAPVSAAEEIRRVLPVIERIRKNSEIPISIDTQKAEVAAAAVAAGATIINDVSGFHQDPEMWKLMKESDAGAVVMHMRGNPLTMQKLTDYDDLTEDICAYFIDILETADAHGIDRERFMLDPGIGFGKTLEQNLQLIAETATFRTRLDRPLLIGPSRKSFIGKMLNLSSPDDRAWGTAGAVAAAVMNRADAVRVHDVRQMRETAIVAARIRDRQQQQQHATCS